MANKKRVRLDTILTMAGVAAYCWVTKPDDKFNKDKPDYKITLVVEPGGEVDALVEEIKKLAVRPCEEQGFKAVLRAIDKGKVKLPIKDGDEVNEERKDKELEPIEAFAGKMLIEFKSKYQPKLFVPRDLQEEFAANDREVWIMSGDIVKVKAEVNPYDGFGGGISLRLKAVKLIEKMAGLDDGGFGDEDDDDYVTSKPSSRSGSSNDSADDAAEDY